MYICAFVVIAVNCTYEMPLVEISHALIYRSQP